MSFPGGVRMFEGLRLKIGLLVARFHFRKAQDPMIQFTNAVSRARRTLVLVPESTAEAPYVHAVLTYFNRRFPGTTLQVLVRQDLARYLVQTDRSNVIVYTEDEINGCFLPRRRLLQKVKKGTFDVVVDLNYRFSLPSAFLCRETQAPVRIGFVKPYADMFYNLQIQTSDSSTLGAYKRFQHCMEMF
jgi:ADP-heptose:LPS heptosyltransferase